MRGLMLKRVEFEKMFACAIALFYFGISTCLYLEFRNGDLYFGSSKIDRRVIRRLAGLLFIV